MHPQGSPNQPRAVLAGNLDCKHGRCVAAFLQTPPHPLPSFDGLRLTQFMHNSSSPSSQLQLSSSTPMCIVLSFNLVVFWCLMLSALVAVLLLHDTQTLKDMMLQTQVL